MKVRPFARPDLGVVLGMGFDMARESPVYARHPFDLKTVEKLAERVLAEPDMCCFVADTGTEIAGFIVGFIAPAWFSRDRLACDLALYVAPEYRGTSAGLRLMRTFIEWAKVGQATAVRVGISTGISTDRTRRMYERLGLTPIGLVFDMPLTR